MQGPRPAPGFPSLANPMGAMGSHTVSVCRVNVTINEAMRPGDTQKELERALLTILEGN
jgi:hypothetical protein